MLLIGYVRAGIGALMRRIGKGVRIAIGSGGIRVVVAMRRIVRGLEDPMLRSRVVEDVEVYLLGIAGVSSAPGRRCNILFAQRVVHSPIDIVREQVTDPGTSVGQRSGDPMRLPAYVVPVGVGKLRRERPCEILLTDVPKAVLIGIPRLRTL